jgi:hypothetical protein
VACRTSAHFKSFAGKEHKLPAREETMVFRYRNGFWAREE